MKKISIVLASYNGHKYIEEQLNSIINSYDYDQLIEEIIISDDNSCDNTRILVEKYENVKVLINKDSSGVISNFMNGLRNSRTDYVMFCDQDDVWLPEKISCAYSEMKLLEDKHGNGKPLLNFCDLKIVDEKLNTIHESFFKYHSIDFRKRNSYSSIVLNNITPGCVCIINKKMVECLFSSEIYIDSWIMHDWWMMLIATSIGGISFTNKSLMLYRQHNNNVVGYKKNGFLTKMIFLNKTLSNYSSSLDERIIQHKAFSNYLDDIFITKPLVSNLERNIFFIINNECTLKRKFCAIVNYFKNGLSNVPRR